MTTSPEARPSLRLGEHCVLEFGAATATGDGGLTIIAELRHAPTAAVASQPMPVWFVDVGRFAYAEIEGLGRCFAGHAAVDATVQRLRFALNASMQAAIRAGAEFGFGVEHPCQRVGARVRRDLRNRLLAWVDQPANAPTGQLTPVPPRPQ